MALKYICDVCGEEVESEEYYELELRGSLLDEGGWENFESIGGHQLCIRRVTERVADLISKNRAE